MKSVETIWADKNSLPCLCSNGMSPKLLLVTDTQVMCGYLNGNSTKPYFVNEINEKVEDVRYWTFAREVQSKVVEKQ